MYSPQNYSTSNCGADMIALNRPSPVQNLTIKTQVDTAVNNYGDWQYFETPRSTTKAPLQ